MKVALYTAIYGKSDWVKPAPDVDVECKLFTESTDTAMEAMNLGWSPVLVPHNIATVKGDPRITAPMLAHKWLKCHPHIACPDVDVTIWIDGSMEVTVPNLIDLALEALGDDDVSFTPHPWRQCIYDEAAYSATLPRYQDEASHIVDQADFYRSIGHPPYWGLFATGFRVNRINARTQALGENWWYENITRSHQDQVSLPVLVRLAEEGGLRWNQNCPWWTWWTMFPHGSAP
jgi:hypothetical protein